MTNGYISRYPTPRYAKTRVDAEANLLYGVEKNQLIQMNPDQNFYNDLRGRLDLSNVKKPNSSWDAPTLSNEESQPKSCDCGCGGWSGCDSSFSNAYSGPTNE